MTDTDVSGTISFDPHIGDTDGDVADTLELAEEVDLSGLEDWGHVASFVFNGLDVSYNSGVVVDPGEAFLFRRGKPNIRALPDTSSTLALSGTEGWVYLAADLSRDQLYYQHDAGKAPPDDPSVLVATGNSSDENAIPRGRSPVWNLTPSPADRVVQEPNGSIQTAKLQDTESTEIPVPLPDKAHLDVYRWGGYKIADSTAPSGLVVQLLSDGDAVQTSENTIDNYSTVAPIASYQNTTGSPSICKLRVDNGTGNDYTADSGGVGAHFGYVIRE